MNWEREGWRVGSREYNTPWYVRPYNDERLCIVMSLNTMAIFTTSEGVERSVQSLQLVVPFVSDHLETRNGLVGARMDGGSGRHGEIINQALPSE